MTERRVPEGIDAERVARWLVANVGGMEAPFDFRLVQGGRSNMTFVVTDAGGRQVVLRRPPMSHVLATAHDMGREHRIISALQGSSVPVPSAFGFCADESVNGAPFYVMGFVEGHVLRTAAEAEGVLTPVALGAAGNDLVDVLVALHRVDVDRVGLGDLGRREGYIERQLRRWYGQFLQSQEQAREAGVFRPSPLVGEAHRLLSERVPAQQSATTVHGDYRLDNTIVGPDGQVRAVLDWELCTLGDPLADIGTMLMYSSGRNATGASRPATTLPGFPALTALADRYASRSGRDLTHLAYYAAFANWRLSCISEGVFTRYATGAMGSDRSEATVMAESAERRAHLAMELLEGNDLGAAIG